MQKITLSMLKKMSLSSQIGHTIVSRCVKLAVSARALIKQLKR